MVKRLLKNGAFFLNLPQGDILSASFIIMLVSLISGFFGLIRSRLLVTQFTPDLVGIYFASFILPDNILQILIFSGLGAAFIPVFTKYHKDNEHWILARSVLHASLLLFALITLVAILFTKPLAFLLVPGIQKENLEHINLFVNLTRIILLAQSFFVVSYLFSGILQSYQRFLIPASAALFYNIGIILGIIVFAPVFGMYGVAVGIIIGAFLHLFIQLPFVFRLGFTYNLNFSIFHPGVAEIIRLMLPRAASIAIERLKLTVDTILASIISLSSITYLNFALQIAIFPVSLVGAAIAQAALPFLAKSVAANNMEEFKKHILLSVTHVAFLLTPICVLIVIFHTPVVRLAFGAPYFSWEATVLTSRTLAILSVGIIAQGISNILSKAFLALFDTKTPLLVTFIAMMSAIVVSYVFVVILSLDVRYIALATTIGALINVCTLFVILHRRINGLITHAFIKTLGKIAGIGILLSIVSYSMLKLLEGYFNTNYTLQLILFTLLAVLISSVFYLSLSALFQIDEYKELFSLFKKAGSAHKRFIKEVLVPDETT